MNAGSVRRGGVDQRSRPKDPQHGGRAAEVSGVAVSQDQTVEAIDSARAQIAAHGSLEIAVASGINQPIAPPRAHMQRRAGAKIERGHLNPCTGRPAR